MPRTLGQKSKACYALRIKVSDLQTFNLLYSIYCKKIIGLGHFRRVENNDWPKWKLEEWSILIEILENFLLPQWSGSWNSFTKITYQRKLRPCGYNFWLDYWLAIPLFPHHRSAFSAKEWLTAHTSVIFHDLYSITPFIPLSYVKWMQTSEMADRYDNGCANHIILTGPNGLRNHRVTVEEEHRIVLFYLPKIIFKKRKWYFQNFDMV